MEGMRSQKSPRSLHLKLLFAFGTWLKIASAIFFALLKNA